jgi:hypothetical protein
MKHKKREPHCWQCGVEMELREELLGYGYCYICAEQKAISIEDGGKCMQAIREVE